MDLKAEGPAPKKRRPRVDFNKLTKNFLLDKGFTVEKTERWCPFSMRRKDLFQFIDFVALAAGQIIGVQSTSYEHKSDRRAKIQSLQTALDWCKAGGHIWLLTWKKVLNKWQPNLEIITAGEIVPSTEPPPAAKSRRRAKPVQSSLPIPQVARY